MAEEPVWFVRVVLALILVGFALFLALEVDYLVQRLREVAGFH